MVCNAREGILPGLFTFQLTKGIHISYVHLNFAAKNLGDAIELDPYTTTKICVHAMTHLRRTAIFHLHELMIFQRS